MQTVVRHSSRWLVASAFVGAFATACSSSAGGTGVDGGPGPDDAKASTPEAGLRHMDATQGREASTTHPDAGGAFDAVADTTLHEAGALDGSRPVDAPEHEDAGSNEASTTGTDAPGTLDGESASEAATDAGASASDLHVSGNQLVDHGKNVRLLGVDRAGSEYACIQNFGFFDGPVDQTAVTAMLSWHINAVRVPLNEDCWLAINGSPTTYSGSAYQAAIVSYVSLLRANGLYVILDLHWNAGGTNVSNAQQEMADSDHAPDFWTGVATTFKGDLGIVFDLYNEPHDVTWACWLNGGCQTNGWNVAGMNQLIAAVRGTGATNVVMAGGLAYSGDLSEWLANEPTDPLGNLAASFHSYNFSNCSASSCWTSQLAPVLAKVPLVTGEIGENDCASTYIDGYMAWADSAGISYLGWAWNADDCSSFPSLISAYDGTPTAFGAGYQSHLATVNP